MRREWRGGRPIVYASSVMHVHAYWIPRSTGRPWDSTPAWRWWCPACLTASPACPTRLHAMTEATRHATTPFHAVAVGHPHAGTMGP